ncbi:MAG: winged helix-turn-helix domain-containing protein [Coprobacillaceae bacterium]
MIFFGDQRIVDSHIKNIRKKLDCNYIETVRGVGYRVKKMD